MGMPSQTTIHERMSDDDEMPASSDRAFGLVFGTVFLLIALWPLVRGEAPHWWALVPVGLFATVALLHPAALAPLNRLWVRGARLLSRVTTPIMMGFVFYSTLTPIGLLLRLSGRDLLRLERDPSSASYWLDRQPPGPRPETIRNQF